jgi:hypothetical protein
MEDQLGVIDGKKFHEYPKWEGRGLPLRETCDLSNPRQRFLWMFVAMPMMKGAPLMLPTEYWEYMSWRLCVLGAGIIDEPQIKYQAVGNLTNPWTAAGKWVDKDTPEPERKSLADSIDALPANARAEVRNYVLDRLGREDEESEVPLGKYRVFDVAKRLNISTDQMIAMLSNFGIKAKPETFVGREITDRILHHMGLDA